MEQTADTFYFLLPPNPNSALADEALLDLDAAGGSSVPGGSSGICEGTVASVLEISL